MELAKDPNFRSQYEGGVKLDPEFEEALLGSVVSLKGWEGAMSPTDPRRVDAIAQQIGGDVHFAQTFVRLR